MIGEVSSSQFLPYDELRTLSRLNECIAIFLLAVQGEVEIQLGADFFSGLTTYYKSFLLLVILLIYHPMRRDTNFGVSRAYTLFGGSHISAMDRQEAQNLLLLTSLRPFYDLLGD